MKKQFVYIVLIVISVMFLGYSLFSYFNAQAQPQKGTQEKKKLIIKPVEEKIIQNIPAQEPAVEVSMDDIMGVEEVPQMLEQSISDEEKYKMLEDSIKDKLTQRMNFVYKQCKAINTQNGIKKKLKTAKYKDVFLADFDGDTLYGSNDAKDINARTIVLEQIQKVRKNGKAFIVSDVGHDGEKRYILVKNLNLGKLYIGVDTYSKGF